MTAKRNSAKFLPYFGATNLKPATLPRTLPPSHIRIYMQSPAPSRPSPSRPDRGAQDRLRRTGVPSRTSERRSACAPTCRSHLRADAQRRDTSRACIVRGPGSGAHAPLRTLCERVRPVIIKASSPSSSSGPERHAPALAAGNRPQLPADAPRRPRDRRYLCPNPKGLKVAGSNPNVMATF